MSQNLDEHYSCHSLVTIQVIKPLSEPMMAKYYGTMGSPRVFVNMQTAHHWVKWRGIESYYIEERFHINYNLFNCKPLAKWPLGTEWCPDLFPFKTGQIPFG